MEMDKRGYYVEIRYGLHPDNFSCVPSERTRRALSRLTEAASGQVGSTFLNLWGEGGMPLEEASRIAEQETNLEGYTTEAMGDTKLVSRGVVRECQPLFPDNQLTR